MKTRAGTPRLFTLFVVVLAAAISLPAAWAAAGPAHHRHHTRLHMRALASSSNARATMTTVSPLSNATVAGTIAWQVKVTGTTTPSRVDFAIDGNYMSTDNTSPYAFGSGLDTTTLSDGTHTLSATAYAKKGKLATTWVSVKVENTPAPAAESPAPAEEPTSEEPASEPSPPPAEEEPAPAPAATGPAPASVFWGAWIGNQLTGNQPPWDMTAVTKFEGMTQKKLSILNFSAPFANCSSSPCSFYKFPANEMSTIRSHGSIPFFSWASQSIPSTKEEPNFQLSDVIAGTYDSYIREWATAAKNWGHPFFLRFNWEMNGRWFPWSEGVNGNKSGEFVTAWRHVHDIFTSVGANNVTWVWCPNIDPGNIFLSLSSQYPGNEYVDWTGLDGYNWGTNPAKPDRWRSFGELYKSTYAKITETVAPSKPMIVGEISSTEYGGSKAAWIKDTLAKVPTEYPKIRGVLWFEKYDSNMDWPIETSSSATEAFASAINSPAYTGNEFASLGSGKIQPPS